MERRKIRLFLVSCVLFMIGSAWLLFFYYKAESLSQILVFPESGFYLGDITVEVRRLSGKESIYYTVDGKEPAEDGNNVIEYTGPISLHEEPEGKAYSFSFFCLSEEGTYLELAERNYIVMEEARTLGTDYVVCVQGDEEELFGYEEGIFVRGRRWDEYMEKNPDVDPRHILVPANYYENTECAVQVAIFTGTGEEIISQSCGIRIYGKASRAQNQKSFRLIARFRYDEENEFFYPFFSQLISDNTGSSIQSYQRLSFHNGGQDNGYAFIRNTLCNELARQAGFPDVLVSRSATVYMNGRYMGVYWLQNVYDDRYFNEKYGAYQGEMVVCEGNLCELAVSDGQETWKCQYAEDYNDFCTWLKTADVNDPAVWQRVTETIDVKNLLQYVAIEYYVNNFDWPGANVKAYCYVPAKGEEYRDGTVFDGRYRYLLFDVDYGLGLIFYGWIGWDASEEVLGNLCDTNNQTTMVFAKVMERKECRDAFINEVVNLGNGSFSKENVDRVLDQFNSSRWNELEYMVEQTNLLEDSPWVETSIATVEEELKSIRKFAEDRRARVLTELMYTWDCGVLFQVESEAQEEIRICINDQEVTEYSWYFAGIPIVLSAEVSAGIRIKGYEVNGEYVEGDRVELLAEQYLKDEEKLNIVPQYEYVEIEQLSIHSFSVRRTQDWVMLENTGSTEVCLEDYFLSDDADDFLKGRLPNVILEPGECITVYGDKYEGEMEKKSFQVDFSWAKEEPVVLAHLTEGIVERRN